MKKYICLGGSKLSTEDNYEEGEIGQSSHYDLNIKFTFDTVEEFKNHVTVESELSLYEDCLEYNQLEDLDGDIASDYQIEQWKLGKLRLWSCNYSYHIAELKELNIEEFTKLLN